jgi:3-dehydroquinate synthase
VPTVRVRIEARPTDYEIVIGKGVISDLGKLARRRLSATASKIALISNKRVFELFGDAVQQNLENAGFEVHPWLMGEGERYKSDRTLNKALEFLSESRLGRSDAVFALGGGVVGDLAGFAAAVYMRGLPLVQIPTTLLSQIDSSVGGKTAINTPRGKNLIGAFHQPYAVVIDTDTLASLPRRELTAGYCEAIKQGAAGDRSLFDRTHGFLLSTQGRDHLEELGHIIALQCEFKASIVAGDELEDVGREDSRSRKILNFGHTTAHALEAVTAYKRFRHGEAVGYGMIVAGLISKGLGLLDQSELELLKEAVRACGRLPRCDDLNIEQIVESLAHDKKTVLGKLKWVLLNRVGHAVIVDGDLISPKLLRDSLHTAFRRNTTKFL